MATTNIVDKDGKTINAADATVPSDRHFRGAWTLSGSTISEDITENISIQEVSFKGLGLLSFALTKKIIIEEVTFNDVNIFQYKISKVKTKKVPKVNFDLDSIELNNLNYKKNILYNYILEYVF